MDVSFLARPKRACVLFPLIPIQCNFFQGRQPLTICIFPPPLSAITPSDQYYRPSIFHCRLYIVVLCLKSPSSSLHLGNLLELPLTYGPDSPQLSSLPIIRTLSCQSLDGLINSSVPTCIKLPAQTTTSSYCIASHRFFVALTQPDPSSHASWSLQN